MYVSYMHLISEYLDISNSDSQKRETSSKCNSVRTIGLHCQKRTDHSHMKSVRKQQTRATLDQTYPAGTYTACDSTTAEYIFFCLHRVVSLHNRLHTR